MDIASAHSRCCRKTGTGSPASANGSHRRKRSRPATSIPRPPNAMARPAYPACRSNGKTAYPPQCTLYRRTDSPALQIPSGTSMDSAWIPRKARYRPATARPRFLSLVRRTVQRRRTTRRPRRTTIHRNGRKPGRRRRTLPTGGNRARHDRRNTRRHHIPQRTIPVPHRPERQLNPFIVCNFQQTVLPLLPTETTGRHPSGDKRRKTNQNNFIR